MPLFPETIEIRLPKTKIAGNVAEITWSDQKKTVHSSYQLRMVCPCAKCRNTHNPDPNAVRGPIGVPPFVEIEAFDWVGNYALNFMFSDGHNSGIYTYKHVRELDESANGV